MNQEKLSNDEIKIFLELLDNKFKLISVKA